MAYAEPIYDEKPVTIKVYKPCSCGPCSRNERWFHCQDVMMYTPDVVYDCQAIDGYPTQASIDYVWSKHPGMVLVY